ncbi:hypothetical protein [Bradyrhizobium sp. 62]|uniref:hypothetical protein n=1 Tax=Bradyrhizobium sp. 62 TaxID=1043588 RepID=UPI001FFA1D4B|nr:hypothetical protein [Bradyrhizobium sp. 62]MCK1365174.1 DDE-type integrase/transposase/recombinase [Bradyrhizobium sp. 62]
MVKVRNIPGPIHGALGQPERMRFGDDDRIILADDIDYRPFFTNDDGHILQAKHDLKIKREISHAEMRVEASKASFRHDRHYYATGAMKARLRAGVADLKELPFEERQSIMWKEDLIREFERLENLYPKTVTRGAPLKKVITRLDKIIRLRHSRIADNGRRSYAGRLKMFFDPPGPKAFLEWVNAYVDADRDPLVLRSRKYKSGNFDERLAEDLVTIVANYARRFASRNKPSVNGLRCSMKAEIEKVINPKRKKEGKPPLGIPSYGRLKREIDDMDWFEKLAGREGPDEALRQARAYGDGIVDVLRPLQQVEIDHWNVGLRTILTKTGVWTRLNRPSRRKLQKVRMVLGAAICRRTHCVLAMTLSRTASVESAVRLIEMAVSDKKRFADAANCQTPYDIYGIMEMIFFDGGPAFNNSEIRSVLRDLKVDFEIPPGGLPHFRGMIERLFRTLDQRVISWFEGRTFSDVVAKGDYDPDARAGTRVEELGQVLVRYVVDRHHNTPLKALGGETPRECYLRLTKKHGVLPPPDSHKLRNVFGIDLKRVLTSGGIRFLNIQYRSRALHEHRVKVGGVEMECRVHPANLGAISVKIGTAWLTVKAPPEFDGVDAETWIAAEAAMRKKMAHTEKTITGPIINAAIMEIERTSEIGRKRAQIDDSPIRRKALLAAEMQMRIFADYPDELDETAPEPSVDVYESAIPVASDLPPVRRRRKAAKRTKARRRAGAKRKPTKSTRASSAPSQRPAGGRKPSKPGRTPTPTSKRSPTRQAGLKRARGRRPGLKRGWTAKD